MKRVPGTGCKNLPPLGRLRTLVGATWPAQGLGDLLAHGLDHAVGRVGRVDADLLEAGRLQDRPVLHLGALLGPEKHQHQHIEQLGPVVGIAGLDNLLHEPQPRPRLHRPVAGAKDRGRCLVRPVVDD